MTRAPSKPSATARTVETAHARETMRAKFLERLAELGNVSGACRHAGVGRQTVYRWRDQEPEFDAAWIEAETTATEVLEAEAWRRAVTGVDKQKPHFHQGVEVGRTIETEYSDTLLITLLKARAPEKYRERMDMTTGGQPMTKAYALEDLLLLDHAPGTAAKEG